MGPTRKSCVYTVLLGGYEELNEQPTAATSSIPFICLTDDPTLESASWQIRRIAPVFTRDPMRSQRDLKIRAHLALGEFEQSLYIDNSVVLTAAPERILDLLPASNDGLVLMPHSDRATVLDEFLEVSRLGYDDATRIFEQLNHYLLDCPEAVDQRPWWTGLLARRHDSPVLNQAMDIWAQHVLRYSRRDQLSLCTALMTTGIAPTPLAGRNESSDYHRWPVLRSRRRRGDERDSSKSLLPLAARVRAAETQARQLESELRRLGRPAARGPGPGGGLPRVGSLARAGIRRVGRLARRLTHPLGLREAPAKDGAGPRDDAAGQVGAGPDGVRNGLGTFIHLDPADTRARHLAAAGGALNAPTHQLWQRLLAEGGWTHVYDVGANYGEMLVGGGLPPGATITAIEPNTKIRSLLERTLAGAGVEARVLDIALADHPGERALRVNKTWSGMSRLAVPGEGGDMMVRTDTLGNLLRSAGSPPGSMRVLVKIDVEGAEAAVLRGVVKDLPTLGGFAALVELLHVPAQDLQWIDDNFSAELLRLDEPDELLAVPPGLLRHVVQSKALYGQDVILRRRRDSTARAVSWRRDHPSAADPAACGR